MYVYVSVTSVDVQQWKDGEFQNLQALADVCSVSLGLQPIAGTFKPCNVTLIMRYKNKQKIVVTRFVFLELKMHQIPFSVGGPARTPLVELTTL